MARGDWALGKASQEGSHRRHLTLTLAFTLHVSILPAPAHECRGVHVHVRVAVAVGCSGRLGVRIGDEHEASHHKHSLVLCERRVVTRQSLTEIAICALSTMYEP